MQILLGLDPGGAGNFGWCIALYTDDMPMIPLACGLSNNAHQAIHFALASIPEGATLVSAGIDAPLFWSKTGTRNADHTVRHAIKQAGAPHVSGTVQDINSLRGACLVQGMLAALELRDRYPELPITEAHPKALRWLLPNLLDIEANSEHERDAMLAAVSAWAAYKPSSDWEDLLAHEENSYTPVSMPVYYMMPNAPGLKQKHKNDLEGKNDKNVTSIILYANEVFGSRAKAMRWLNSPNYQLQQKTPLAQLDSVVGRNTVVDMLIRIAHGVYI